VSIHVFGHLGVVLVSHIVLKVTVTDDCLLLLHNLVVLAKLLELVLVGIVPGALTKQVIGVLIGSLVDQGIDVDPGAVEARSEVVDCLHDLTTHLAHLVQGRQACICGIVLEVNRLTVTILRLNIRRQTQMKT